MVSASNATLRAQLPTPTPPTHPPLTLQQFAEATATGESTIRQWVQEGIIKAYSANGHNLRIPASEIERVFQPVQPSGAKQRPRQRTVPSQEEGKE